MLLYHIFEVIHPNKMLKFWRNFIFEIIIIHSGNHLIVLWDLSIKNFKRRLLGKLLKILWAGKQ